MTHCRNSNIELLKIIGIILIVLNHVVQSLSEPNRTIASQEYVFNVCQSTTDFQTLVVSMMCYFGNIANTIFFACSSWFLIDSSRVKWRKVFQMVFDVWIISMLFFLVVALFTSINLTTGEIIRQFFPTLFSNNWYITCYLLFYTLHPILNKSILSLGKASCFYFAVGSFILYFVLSFINGQFYFFSSILIYWCVIYIVIAFVKLYMPAFSTDRRVYLSLISLGLTGIIGIIVATNYLGLHFELFSNQLQRWNLANNPFILVLVLGLLLWGHNNPSSSTAVNYISSLSLLVYVIHENYLFREFLRPKIWYHVYNYYSYDHILLWVFIIATSILLLSIMLSALYKAFSRHLLTPITDRLYSGLYRIFSYFDSLIINLQ